MEVERILEQLRVNRGSFPRRAVEAAVEKRDEIVPHLVESIEDARRQADGLPPDLILHVFAMYLLAQFRERTAFRPFLDFLSLPGQLALDLTGDVVTEDMHRILASVAHGEIEPMLALVQRRDLDEYPATRCADAGSVAIRIRSGTASLSASRSVSSRGRRCTAGDADG